MKGLRRSFERRKILVTGHTGFKGAWLSLWLHEMGADVSGFSLPPSTKPSLFEKLGLAKRIDSTLGDLRDRAAVLKAVRRARPEFIFHLAAQPLVRRSYEDPAETFSTNIMGLVNLLDAVRKSDSVRVCQVITSDKCYENDETGRACNEADALGGRDPYSASKACAEIVAASYRRSFFKDGVSLATARAGNVIGGGDWSADRILPDCLRALSVGKPIVVRNPDSIRPWQHVFDPLTGYLMLAARQFSQPKRFSQAFNFGPAGAQSVSVRDVVNLVVKEWGGGAWIQRSDGAAREAGVLRLDCAKSRNLLGWVPRFDVALAVRETVRWHRAASVRGFDALVFSRERLAAYPGPR